MATLEDTGTGYRFTPIPTGARRPTLLLRIRHPTARFLPEPQKAQVPPFLEVSFILDSGAQTCVMEPGCARQLHLSKTGGGTVNGVSGKIRATTTSAEVEIKGLWYLITFLVPENQPKAECLLGWNVIEALKLFRPSSEVQIRPESLPVAPNCPVVSP